MRFSPFVSSLVFYTNPCRRTLLKKGVGSRGILAVFLLLIIGTERSAPGTALIAGLYMDRDRCPGVLGIQVGFEVVGEVVGLCNGNIARHHEMELDEDLRP